jgi:hypothetical protein
MTAGKFSHFIIIELTVDNPQPFHFFPDPGAYRILAAHNATTKSGSSRGCTTVTTEREEEEDYQKKPENNKSKPEDSKSKHHEVDNEKTADYTTGMAAGEFIFLTNFISSAIIPLFFHRSRRVRNIGESHNQQRLCNAHRHRLMVVKKEASSPESISRSQITIHLLPIHIVYYIMYHFPIIICDPTYHICTIILLILLLSLLLYCIIVCLKI